MKKTISIIFTLFLLWTTDYGIQTMNYGLNAEAAVPHLINYQGRLTDTSGTPLNGSYTINFKIYDAETAGTLLWEETNSSVVIQKGIFNVLLGSVTALNLTFDKPYFLEIKVGNEVLNPRQRITSAGYAIRAETAEKAEQLAVEPLPTAKGGTGATANANTANGVVVLDANSKIPAAQLGAWVDKSSNYGAQQATTDGFVCLYIDVTDNGAGQYNVFGYTDSNSNPTTIRGACTFQYTPESGRTNYHSFMMPVKKNDYWKITFTESGSKIINRRNVYWIPLGS